MSAFAMAGTVSTPFPALIAEDQGMDSGLLAAIGDDAWLVIPFALGFIVFGSPWGKVLDQMMHRLYSAFGLREVGLPSTLNARLAGAWPAKADDQTAPRSPTSGVPERATVDVEYLTVHSELSAIRSEILRERGSTCLA